MNALVPTLFLLVMVASVAACHAIADSRGGNPVFWGIMGALFGPLAIPFAFLAGSRGRKDKKR